MAHWLIIKEVVGIYQLAWYVCVRVCMCVCVCVRVERVHYVP